MKNLYKKITILIVLVSSVFYFNCETTELDDTIDPNTLQNSQAQVELLSNSAQVGFGKFIQGIGNAGAEVTRLKYMSGRQYVNAYAATFFNVEWQWAYRDVLNSVKILKPIATEKKNHKHLAMAQVLEAYTLVTLVDFFGNVPYSEAFDLNNLNPKPDNGAALYSKAISLLNEAIVNFNLTTLDRDLPKTDLYYNLNWSKWIKFANTIKLKIYVQSRLVNANAVSEFNTIITANNFITSSADDFQFKWSTNISNPNSRHPYYIDSYTGSGVNSGYQSNWLLNVMKNEKSVQDPRMRYYFYRQTDNTPVSEQNLKCTIEPIPSHYLAGNHVFCRIAGNEGYWGRDHGNAEGIPPDGQLRTSFGVYPAGGKFDDDDFEDIAGNTLGGRGAGITPILLASTVDFWRAEMALQVGGTGNAKTFLTSGVSKSIAKVATFISLDPTANNTFVPTSADIANYISDAEAQYDAATEKLQVINKEFFISLFGNGIDAYNAYRRTGFPKNLQPNLEPNPGSFIRSFYYPASESNTNSNMPQKPNVGVRVFWDNNPSTGFPISN
jgi:hypothetical protein